jgi:hypothetical protein
VPGKDLEETLWWSFPGAAKKNRTEPQPEKKNWDIRNDIYWQPY